jgi:hypothetical protein
VDGNGEMERLQAHGRSLSHGRPAMRLCCSARWGSAGQGSTSQQLNSPRSHPL